MRNRPNGYPIQTYRAGQGIHEKPGDTHDVFANTGDTQPARVQAIIVMDTPEQELGIPVQ